MVKVRIQLMQSAVKEYPRNQVKENNEFGYTQEALRICERILEDCTNNQIRHEALNIL